MRARGVRPSHVFCPRADRNLQFFLASGYNSSYSLKAKVGILKLLTDRIPWSPTGSGASESTPVFLPQRDHVFKINPVPAGETQHVMNTLSLDTTTLQQAWNRFSPLPAKLALLPSGILRIHLQNRPIILDVFDPDYHAADQTLRLSYRLQIARADRPSGLQERVLGWLSARVQNHLPGLLNLAEWFGVAIPPGIDIDDTRICIRPRALPFVANWLVSIHIHKIHLADNSVIVTFHLSEAFYETFTAQSAGRAAVAANDSL